MWIVTRISQCAADDLGLRAGSEARASLKARSLYLLARRLTRRISHGSI